MLKFLSVFLFSFIILSCDPFILPRSNISVLTFNVETLFDTEFLGNEYDGFNSADTWNLDAYYKKLSILARTIEHSILGGPDILALQEVENPQVVEDLINIFMPGSGYRDMAFGKHERNILGLAIVSRFPIVMVRSHKLHWQDDTQRILLRPILEVTVKVDDHSLIIFNNHWKSKYDGAEDSTMYRRQQASLLMHAVSYYSDEDQILVLGDFNESIDEFQRIDGLYSTALGSVDDSSDTIIQLSGQPGLGDFVTPWLMRNWDIGSYYYKNTWESIDAFFLSHNFFDDFPFRYEKFYPVQTRYNTDQFGRPFRWDRFRHTGCSDHLPLVLKLSIHP